MLRGFWLIIGFVCGIAAFASAQEIPDSLKSPLASDSVSKAPATIYVIPAGPVAGSFTDQSRIQVVDTVAGWAKILIEGWVPVEKVVSRMSEDAPKIQLTEVEKPKKVKAERPQCIAMTTKGKQCTRRSIPGSKKCWQHSQ